MTLMLSHLRRPVCTLVSVLSVAAVWVVVPRGTTLPSSVDAVRAHAVVMPGIAPNTHSVHVFDGTAGGPVEIGSGFSFQPMPPSLAKEGAVTPDSRQFYVTNGPNVDVWDLVRQTLETSFPVVASEDLAITPDGRYVLVAGRGELHVYDRAGGFIKTITVLTPESHHYLYGVATSADGAHAYALYVDSSNGPGGEGLAVFDFDGLSPVDQPAILARTIPLPGHGRPFVVSPNGQFVYAHGMAS